MKTDDVMKKLVLLSIICAMIVSAKAAEADPFLSLYLEISQQNNSQSNDRYLYELLINSYIPALATDSVKTNALISEYLSNPTPSARAFANVYKNHFLYEELDDLVKLTGSDEYIQAMRKSEGFKDRLVNFVNYACQEIYNDSVIPDLSIDQIPESFINRYKMYVERMESFDINNAIDIMVANSMAELMGNIMKFDDDNIDFSSISSEELDDYINKKTKKAEELLPKNEKATDFIRRNYVHFLIQDSYYAGITIDDLDLIDNPLKHKEFEAVMDLMGLDQKELQKETIYDFNSFLKTNGYEISPENLKILEENLGF